MNHVIKLFVVVMLFSSTVALAQSTTDAVKEKTTKKTEKVYKSEDDKRIYKAEKKHLASKMTAEQKIAGMDANKDGKISTEEASNAENKWYSENFSKVDSNSDGFIDVNEMKAKMAKKKKNKMKKSKEKLEY